ncbi:MAG: hydrogenase maturation nickel metallochaperone HypA [Candidatus Cloacimonetes bacterium]|nr:hydrogenase maturation nickel metallochaperone HypA [Candidatus Cloacimonadota bacterium]
MHEGVIVKSLFEIAAKSREESGLNEVQTVKVIVGKFHQIVREVMDMYFELMKKDYAGFSNALLVIEERELKIRCKSCNAVILLKEANFSCSECGSIKTEVVEGNELYIESLIGVDKDKNC